MADKNLSTDIYGTNDYVNAIKQRFIPDVPEDTLMLGIFGYMGQVFSDMMQNSIIMASELSNESIPTKAKFEKNIIAHALSLGIDNINAIPAQMDVLMTFIEDDIINSKNAIDSEGNELPWTFVFDKDTPIHIGDHCFYVDYDIEIRKIRVHNTSNSENKFAYTARYLIDVDNPISDITNPYLSAPVKMRVNGINVLFTKCTLRQVTKTTIHKKVLSDNSISAKTATFTFEGQLAAFTVDVVEGDKTTHLIPIYDGISAENTKYKYIYYSYLDTNTIRIKFDKASYMPRINSDVNINLIITEGENGNFIYKPNTYPSFSFESDKYGYSAIGCEIRPITGESAYGINKKSVSELKRLIPKEALSRGCITSTADLQNCFNAIDTEDSVVYIYKKRDNALERLYYMYILMRDDASNIIPTNTIDLKVLPGELMADNPQKLILRKNQIIGLNYDDEYASIYEKGDAFTVDFNYRCPYNVVINMDPLYAMYYMTAIDTNKFLEFSYINKSSQYQFIAMNAKLYRANNSNKYTITVTIEQSIHINSSDLEIDESGNIVGSNIRCIAVFYTDENVPVRWSEAAFVSCIPDADIFTFKFTMTTYDCIDIENRLRMETGLNNINTEEESIAYFSSNMKCTIFILNKQDASYGNSELHGIVPNISEYTVCNSYNVVDGVDFFYDYSDIINSTVMLGTETEDDDDTAEGGDSGGGNTGSDLPATTLSDGDSVSTLSSPPKVPGPIEGEDSITVSKAFKYLIIKSVPVVADESKLDYLCSEIVRRKIYIDQLLNTVEDLFGIDFKFFNTYGPSKLFTIDGTTCIDRVNINIAFRVKLAPTHDSNIINDITAYIKNYIEDINNIKSIHMSNLVSEITTKFRDQIDYFEYVGINKIPGSDEYDTSVKHIYASDMPDGLVVPEFLNITTDYHGALPINIIIE